LCASSPVSRGCGPFNLMNATIPRLAGRNCRRLDTLWILFLWPLTVAMTTPTPQAAKRLPAVRLDVAKTLTTVEFCQPVLGTINLDLYNYVAKRCQFEAFLSFLIPC
jgi:hypothetical protein